MSKANSNVSINRTSSISKQPANIEKIDVAALISNLRNTAIASATVGADTLPYTVNQSNDGKFVSVAINSNCRNTDAKRTALGFLDAFTKSGLAIQTGDSYEFLGDDTYTPHTLLAEFIRLESEVREAKKNDRKARRERESKLVASAATTLDTFKATTRDKLIADYHAGKISREEMLAIVNA